jgi:hypothetical protein
MYLSPNLKRRKKGVGRVMAAFTDNLAVCLHITLDAPILRRGRVRWEINVSLLDEQNLRLICRRNGYNGDNRKGNIRV